MYSARSGQGSVEPLTLRSRLRQVLAERLVSCARAVERAHTMCEKEDPEMRGKARLPGAEERRSTRDGD